MSLIQKVKKTISQYQLIKPGDSVMVGVSGGPDSVALLHVLHQLRHELGIQLFAAHVNHQLRKGAERDEKFVRHLCDSLQVSCSTSRVNIKSLHQKGSLENIAREKRINALIRMAKRKKANIIALAHHRDDLVETVLMRILRGSGLLGLQGILPRREIKGFTVIRPCIDTPKKDIERFIRKKNIKFRTDPTNKQTRFFRNKIRLELLPLLEKQYNRNIREVLAHLANNIAVDYDYLQGEGLRLLKKLTKNSSPIGEKRLSIPLAPFTRLHPGLQRMMIRLAFSRFKGNMNRMTLTHIKEVEDLLKNRPQGAIVNLPGGVRVRKEKFSLILSFRGEPRASQ